MNLAVNPRDFALSIHQRAPSFDLIFHLGFHFERAGLVGGVSERKATSRSRSDLLKLINKR